MAYPEPIPEIKGKNAKEFLKRQKNFKLTGSQKRLYKDAVKYYNETKPKRDK